MLEEPVAIIGIGCRFPGGASSPDALWRFLLNRGDGIIDVPPDRWDVRRFYDPDVDKPGKMFVRQSGFLQEPIDQFDPLFFGISPREAPNMDPQQRLLLEVTYEAFEDAGLQLEALRGSDTGVFIGGFLLDHKMLQLSPLNRDVINQHTPQGITMAILSNRISYTFDLRGPSVSMDTACSSSLVATHFACQSLGRKDCSLAVVGGVNAILCPETLIALTKARFLSPHSRCKAFDTDAAGYVRSEGAGVVLLKPYRQALRDRDAIYAVIEATGVNQDGQTAGISMPNPEAQKALLRKVYRESGIDLNTIHYIEAHGTGTQAGDPAEIEALHDVLAEHLPPGKKVLVGSIKTNLGHLEPAAGVAGVIKAALCLHHKQVPPNVHFREPNPKLDLERRCVRVPTDAEALPEDQVSRAVVNSFGYGGTNAHAVLRETDAPAVVPSPVQPPLLRSVHLAPISARDPQALKERCRQYAAFLRQQQPSLRDVVYTLAHRRSHHQCRLAVVGDSLEQLTARLAGYHQGAAERGVVSGQVQSRPTLVFVFTGMGPQWWGMGRELFEQEPVFGETLTACDRIFHQHAGWSILAELLAAEADSRMAETQIAQPANFLIQAGLTALWRHYGIRPDVVVGHSVGEVSAAYVSGALSLEDALLVSYHRSRLQQQTAGQGTMLAAGLSEAEAATLIQAFPHVSIGAINSPSAVTLSGDASELRQIAQLLEAQQRFNRHVQVEVPYHSVLMEPLQTELCEVLQGLRPRAPATPCYSTVTGCQVAGTDLSPAYWWRNVREPVRFATTVASILHAHGHVLFLEVGPHPVLRASLQECAQAGGTICEALSSLRRKEPELPQVLETLGALYAAGLPVDWTQLAPPGDYVKLPSYPWQKQAYYHDSARSRQDRLGSPGHLFLNTRLPAAQPTYEVELNRLFFPFLHDHRVQGLTVFPGAAYVEAGFALARAEKPEATAYALEDLDFTSFLALTDQDTRILQTTLDPSSRRYAVTSRTHPDGTAWTTHAVGRVVSRPLTTMIAPLDLPRLQARCTRTMPSAQLYSHLEDIGLRYLDYFRTVQTVSIGDDEVLARIAAHPALGANPDSYIVHPTLLDAGLQLVGVFGDQLQVPTRIGHVSCYSSPATSCWAYLKVTQRVATSIKADLWFCDDQGRVSVAARDVAFEALSGSAAARAASQWFYESTWQPQPAPAPRASAGACLLFGDDSAATREIVSHWTSQGVETVVVTAGGTFRERDPRHFEVQPGDAEHLSGLIQATLGCPLTHVLYLWPFVHWSSSHTVTVEAILAQTQAVIGVVQALTRLRPDDALRLTLVTQEGQFVREGDHGENLVCAPLWGLARLISNECPQVTCQVVDLDAASAGQLGQVIWQEALAPVPADDVAYRAGERFVKELRPLTPTQAQEETEVNTAAQPVEVQLGTPGQLDSLRWCACARPDVPPGHLEVLVHSAGLNYKDVLKALGVLSPQVLEGTYCQGALGSEASGVVSAVGPGVTGYRVGDEVVAFARSGNLKSYVTVPLTHVTPKPRSLSVTEASAAVPFMTVVYGLGHVARLRQGDKILIHQASGGVGLAAVQFARWRGAEIFATAGTPDKRAYLESIGVHPVMDSRTLEFAEVIRAQTRGYGVDVVLGAVGGETFYQSVRLLAPYGRYVEIGKQQIVENAALPLRHFHRNLLFASVDLDQLVQQRVDVLQEILQEIQQGFAQGHLHALPVRVFPAAQVGEAFRLFAESKQIGRVAVEMFHQPVRIARGDQAALVRPEATYLITGGTRGFGLEIARWMVGQGARHLVLVSRSGASTAEARDAVARMTQAGAEVAVFAADVGQAEDVHRMIGRIAETMPPLRGIVHGAMVLDDAWLRDLTPERLRRVMEPKVAGALHLHNATQYCPLDFFICLSSVSSIIGNPGQASYVAANAFLDAFAHYRRARGLPATTVNLGALAETGVAARQADVQAQLDRSGIRGMRTADALHALDLAVRQAAAQVGVFDVDWPVWAEQSPLAAASSRFQSVVRRTSTGPARSPRTQELLDTMASLSPRQRQEYVENLAATELAAILKLPVDKVDRTRPVMEQGVDSLMTTELKSRLYTALGVRLPDVFVFAYPTVERLARYLLEEVFIWEEQEGKVPADAATDDALRQLQATMARL
ncbi:MAG: type I polyketide synthase [Acidobacteriota bacterium]